MPNRVQGNAPPVPHPPGQPRQDAVRAADIDFGTIAFAWRKQALQWFLWAVLATGWVPLFIAYVFAPGLITPGYRHLGLGIYGMAAAVAVARRGTLRPQGDRCDIGAYERVQYNLGDLQLAKSGSHDIELSWADPGGTIVVFRSLSPSGGFTVIGTPSASPFPDEGALDAAGPYFYLLKAFGTP